MPYYLINTDKSLEGSVSELLRFLGAKYQVADNVTQVPIIPHSARN